MATLRVILPRHPGRVIRVSPARAKLNRSVDPEEVHDASPDRERVMSATHARVAEYRGVDPAALGSVLDTVRAEAEADLADPPAGLEALREVLVLADADASRVLAITLFEGEQGLAAGAAVLDRRPASRAGGVRVETTAHRVALRAERP